MQVRGSVEVRGTVTPNPPTWNRLCSGSLILICLKQFDPPQKIRVWFLLAPKNSRCSNRINECSIFYRLEIDYLCSRLATTLNYNCSAQNLWKTELNCSIEFQSRSILIAAGSGTGANWEKKSYVDSPSPVTIFDLLLS